MGGQSPLSGPLRWRAKVILIDLGHLTGDCGHGTCGIGMIVTNDLEFLENFFSLAHLNAKKTTQMAFVNADWPPARRAYASERSGAGGQSALINAIRVVFLAFKCAREKKFSRNSKSFVTPVKYASLSLT